MKLLFNKRLCRFFGSDPMGNIQSHQKSKLNKFKKIKTKKRKMLEEKNIY